MQAVELGYSPIGPPIMSVYFYYLNGLLIDTGQHHMQRHALDAIGDLTVRQILLTHHHEDHSGNAAAFQKKTGAPVRGHILTASKLRKGYRIRLYQHLIWGRTAPVGMATLDNSIHSDPYALVPVETPGHSKDHVVFLEKNFGWLFSGDLYIGERIKFFRSDEDLDAQIHSLQKVMRLDFDTLFCAHNPCPKNGKRHIHYLAHLKMMAAVQPALSGAISKTINMPKESTAEEIASAYMEGWKLGLKAVAIYRDGSKRLQPVNTDTKTGNKKKSASEESIPARPFRRWCCSRPADRTGCRRRCPDRCSSWRRIRAAWRRGRTPRRKG